MHAQVVLFDCFDPFDVIASFEVLHAGGTAVTSEHGKPEPFDNAMETPPLGRERPHVRLTRC